MYRYINSSKGNLPRGTEKTFRNRRNENKYIEVKKANDGHTYSRQYMEWDDPRNSDSRIRNYNGSKSNGGRYHRMNLDTLDQVLDDYDEVESSVDSIDVCNDVGASSQIKSPCVMIGEYADGYNVEMSGNDIGDCIYKLTQLEDSHGDLTWYGGLNDGDYVDGEYVGASSKITSSVEWDDLSPSEQMAVEYAMDYIKFDNMDKFDAADRAVQQVAEANTFDEYAGEDFYFEVPNLVMVYEYLDNNV